MNLWVGGHLIRRSAAGLPLCPYFECQKRKFFARAERFVSGGPQPGPPLHQDCHEMNGAGPMAGWFLGKRLGDASLVGENAKLGLKRRSSAEGMAPMREIVQG